MSYHELNVRANQLANYLLGLGVGLDDRVAVCLERSTEMVIALLGILKAGAAYVPLDPAYPSDRLTFTLMDAAALVVLTQENLTPLVAGTSARVICIDREREIIKREASTSPVTGVTPRNLAYVIYTRVRPGPKGVAIEHTSTVISFTGPSRLLHHKSSQGLAVHINLFDLSVFELFAPCLLVQGDRRR